jgi:Homeodomain-like domain
MPSHKSAPVQQAVIAKRLQGHSKRQIARDLGMGRNTVDRILTESQIEAAVAQGRSQLVELVPKAVQLIQRAIEQGLAADEVPKGALEAAIHVVKGSGAYEERSRTRGDVYVHDEYAKADREQLEAELAERLQAVGSRRPN